MGRRAPVLFGLLLGSSGCAMALGIPEVDYGQSRPIPLVHTSTDRSRWYVPVQVEGGGSQVFFFDTGYAHSTCDDGLIAALGLQTRGRSMIKGELGRLKATKARLPALEFGGHRLEGLVCQVRDLNTTSSIRDPSEVPVAGVIGMDVLRPFLVRIDPATTTVELLPPDSAFPDDPEHTVRLRREFGVGTRVLLPLQVDGETRWPVLDTGASSTLLDAEPLKLDPVQVREGVLVRGSGGSGSSIRTLETFEAQTVRVAAHEHGKLRFTGRDGGLYAHGLLGLDVLGEYRQTYDFAGRRAHLLPVTPAALQSWQSWRDSGNDGAGRVLAP